MIAQSPAACRCPIHQDNPFDEAHDALMLLTVIDDLTTPVTDMHAVDRDALACVLSELRSRFQHALHRIEKEKCYAR